MAPLSEGTNRSPVNGMSCGSFAELGSNTIPTPFPDDYYGLSVITHFCLPLAHTFGPPGRLRSQLHRAGRGSFKDRFALARNKVKLIQTARSELCGRVRYCGLGL